MRGFPYETDEEVEAELAKPLNPDYILTRPGGRGVQLEYFTARTVSVMMDRIWGLFNWSQRYYNLNETAIACEITATLPSGRQVIKTGVGANAPGNPGMASDDIEKSGASDALKRAFMEICPGARLLYKNDNPDCIDARKARTAPHVALPRQSAPETIPANKMPARKPPPEYSTEPDIPPDASLVPIRKEDFWLTGKTPGKAWDIYNAWKSVCKQRVSEPETTMRDLFARAKKHGGFEPRVDMNTMEPDDIKALHAGFLRAWADAWPNDEGIDWTGLSKELPDTTPVVDERTDPEGKVTLNEAHEAAAKWITEAIVKLHGNKNAFPARQKKLLNELQDLDPEKRKIGMIPRIRDVGHLLWIAGACEHIASTGELPK